jgi:ascorbate-specific PTS system EIIC-type component UlaA
MGLKPMSKRTAEDRREAVKISVDAAKSLIQIAVAVFVAIGGFIQYSFNGGFGWLSLPVAFFALAATLVFSSMCAGFCAVSRAYKRAEGREGANDYAWSTLPLKNALNWQAHLGLLGLLAFAAAIIFTNALDHPKSDTMVKAEGQQHEVQPKRP